jgi:hypothetical protein
MDGAKDEDAVLLITDESSATQPGSKKPSST